MSHSAKPINGALEHGLLLLYGSVEVGASGAVPGGAVKFGGGIKSVTRLAQGVYRFTLDQKYNRLLHLSAAVSHATDSGVVAVQGAQSRADAQAAIKNDGTVDVRCLDDAGAEADPASGSLLSIRLDLRVSSYGPYDQN